MHSTISHDIRLRKVTAADLSIFFQQQLDSDANYMAAFTAKAPTDESAFRARWVKILADATLQKQTILYKGEIAGYVVCHRWFGEPEISYWLGKSFWGKGVATEALRQFLGQLSTRPLFARVAQDNIGSRRVLEKCGFQVKGHDRGFANARGEEIDELLLTLKVA